MALPATDNFNGSARNTQLTAHNASWTLCKGDFDIQAVDANALSPDAASNCAAGWNADAFNADQYAQATFVAVVAYVYLGVSVRCDVTTPNDTFYLFYADSTDGSYLEKLVDGVETQLGSKGAAFAVNDVIYLSVSGVDPGMLTPKKNGSLLNPPNTQTDSAIDSGAAGVAGCDDSDSIRIDNWEGGNLAASFSPNVSDSTTVTTTPTVSLPDALARSVSDTIASVVDTPTVSVSEAGAWDVSASDGTTVTDTPTVAVEELAAFTVNVSDSTTATDTPTLALDALAINTTQSVTVSDLPSFGESNHTVQIGNGYADGTPRQVIRTSDNRPWVASWEFDHWPQGTDTGLGQTLRMYKADQIGTPTSFTRMDSANEPADANAWSIAVGASDTIHVLWTKRASWDGGTNSGVDNYVYYCQFNTSAGTWGTAETIESAAAITEYGQGDELCAIAVDALGVPHIVYLKSDGTRRRVNYRNRAGGSWSDATIVDDQTFSGNQRCWHPGIGFDQSGRIAVTWQRGSDESGTDGRIFIRVYESGAWGTTHDVVGANTHVGIDQGTPLYIDSSDRYHTCYISATNKYVQYRYSDDQGATWTANHPGSGTTAEDNPTPGPGPNNTVRIYAHGPGLPVDVRYWQGDGGAGAWGTQVVYSNAATPNDSSANVRWSQYYYWYPNRLDVIYWQNYYPTNVLYLGSDVVAADPVYIGGAAPITESVGVSDTPAVSPPERDPLLANAGDSTSVTDTPTLDTLLLNLSMADSGNVTDIPTVSTGEILPDFNVELLASNLFAWVQGVKVG